MKKVFSALAFSFILVLGAFVQTSYAADELSFEETFAIANEMVAQFQDDGAAWVYGDYDQNYKFRYDIAEPCYSFTFYRPAPGQHHDYILQFAVSTTTGNVYKWDGRWELVRSAIQRSAAKNYIDDYLNILKTQKNRITGDSSLIKWYVGDGKIALVDIMGDAAPELLFMSFFEDYDTYPRVGYTFLHVWTFEGEARQIGEFQINVVSSSAPHDYRIFITADGRLAYMKSSVESQQHDTRIFTYDALTGNLTESEAIVGVEDPSRESHSINGKSVSKADHDGAIRDVVPENCNILMEWSSDQFVASIWNEVSSYKTEMTYSQAIDYLTSMQATVKASPASATVLVNGKAAAFDAYAINDNNYFKLRDLAYVLSGTEKQFEVGWDATANAITLTSGRAYTPVGGEMASKGAGDKSAAPTNSQIYLNGADVSFNAYNIDGNNYCKLRDVGQAFDFGVDWDGAQNTIRIDTNKGYAP